MARPLLKVLAQRREGGQGHRQRTVGDVCQGQNLWLRKELNPIHPPMHTCHVQLQIAPARARHKEIMEPPAWARAHKLDPTKRKNRGTRPLVPRLRQVEQPQEREEYGRRKVCLVEVGKWPQGETRAVGAGRSTRKYGKKCEG